MWESYGIVFIEYIFLNKFRREKDLINIEGKEILDDIIKSTNQLYLFQDISQTLN